MFKMIPQTSVECAKREACSLKLHPLQLVVIDIPDPFGNVIEPNFSAKFFEPPHQIVVAERIQAAKDFSNDADHWSDEDLNEFPGRGSGRGFSPGILEALPFAPYRSCM